MVQLGLWWGLCAVPEARDRFDRALGAFAETPLRARGLAWAALLTQRAGDLEGAAAITRTALALARSTGDCWAEAWALNTAADDSWVRGDGPAARAGRLDALAGRPGADDAWLEQAIEANYVTVTPPEEVRSAGVRGIDELPEAAAAREDDFMRAFLDAHLGDDAAQRGEWDEAERVLAEAQELFARYGSWWWLTAAAPRIEALAALGRIDDAIKLARTTLEYASENLYLAPVDLSRLLVATAALLIARERFAAAAALIAAAGTNVAGDASHVVAYRRVRGRFEDVAPTDLLEDLDNGPATRSAAAAAMALAIEALAD